jgi:hypothetical protein
MFVVAIYADSASADLASIDLAKVYPVSIDVNHWAIEPA